MGCGTAHNAVNLFLGDIVHDVDKRSQTETKPTSTELSSKAQ
jgi:hypothetical protein